METVVDITNELFQGGGEEFVFVVDDFEAALQGEIVDGQLCYVVVVGQQGLGQDGDALAGGHDVDNGIGAVANPFADDGDAPFCDKVREEFPGAGAFLPEYEILVGDVGELDGVSGGEGVVFSADEHHLILVNIFGYDIPVFYGALNDCDIQGAQGDFLHDVCGIVNVDTDIKVWIFLLESGDDAAQEKTAHGQGRAHMDVELAGGVVQVLLHLVKGGGDVLRISQELPAGFGYVQLLGQPVK